MNAAQRIRRVKAPTPGQMDRRYLATQRPVILTNLYEGDPIRRVDTLAKAKRTLAALPVQIKPESSRGMFRAYQRGTPPPPPVRPKASKLGAYLKRLERNPTTDLLCSELDTPDMLRDMFTLPAYARTPPGDDEVLSMIFGAGEGNYAHMHYDGDLRHVILYQVFGRKRILLVPPTQSLRMLPMKNQSFIQFGDFSERDRAEFVRFVGGYDFFLEPGEAVYIPPAWWHHIEYVTTSLSVNVRFGRNRYAKFLGDNLHLGPYGQAVGSRFAHESLIDDVALKQFHRIRRAFHRSYETPAKRYWKLERLLREAFAILCPDAVQAHYGCTRLSAFEAVAGMGRYREYEEFYAAHGRTWPPPEEKNAWKR